MARVFRAEDPRSLGAVQTIPMTLSAVLAVRDEAPMLDGCLRLLGFCDEIVVVVDDRTTDGTEEIARRYTDRVWVERFADFSQHKNGAIARATGEWLLVIDADERITPALAGEIRATLEGSPVEWGFEIVRINHFLGGRLEHGGWTDAALRLVRHEHARYEGQIHERMAIPPERRGRFREALWHFSHRSIEEMLLKTARFGEIQARELYESGAPRVTAWTLARTIGVEFARRMIRRGGWRDGMPGVIEGLYQPFSLFCVQAMLWQRQRREPLWETYQRLEQAAADHR